MSLFAGMALPGTTACRSRARAGTPPSAAPPAPPNAAIPTGPGNHPGPAQGSTHCEWGAFNEGALNLKLDEVGVERVCLGVVCDSVFTAREHGLVELPTTVDLWFPFLAGKTAIAKEARLGFSLPKRWDVTFEKGAPLHLRHVINQMDCPVKSSAEVHTTQTATVIRDAKGKLLLLNAPDVPLLEKGQAMMVAEFAPEVGFSWTDLGCPARQGPGIGAAGGGQRTVGIVVQTSQGGAQAVATWGRNTTLQIGGETYVFSVNQGWILADGLGCGRAAFTLYRQGYLKLI